MSDPPRIKGLPIPRGLKPRHFKPERQPVKDLTRTPPTGTDLSQTEREALMEHFQFRAKSEEENVLFADFSEDSAEDLKVMTVSNTVSNWTLRNSKYGYFQKRIVLYNNTKSTIRCTPHFEVKSSIQGGEKLPPIKFEPATKSFDVVSGEELSPIKSDPATKSFDVVPGAFQLICMYLREDCVSRLSVRPDTFLQEYDQEIDALKKAQELLEGLDKKIASNTDEALIEKLKGERQSLLEHLDLDYPGADISAVIQMKDQYLKRLKSSGITIYINALPLESTTVGFKMYVFRCEQKSIDRTDLLQGILFTPPNKRKLPPPNRP